MVECPLITRFPQQAKAVIQKLIDDKLSQKNPAHNELPALTKELADRTKHTLKHLEKDKRYKYLVQVICGQNGGQGIQMGTRQFWDPNTDNSVHVTLVREGFFITVAAFAVYLY